MNNITITIKKCNNIDYASVDLKLNKLNIKYGINGTGKSTMVRAIQIAKDGRIDLNELIPFKHRSDTKNTENTPIVEGLENIQTAMVFNEEYVNQVLFTQEELVKNSFSIFIKTPEYEKKMAEIERLVSGIKDIFKNDEKLEQVIQDLTALSASFGNSSSGMHASGKLAKAILKGNPLENIPEKLTPYQVFLKMPDNKNVRWLGWHNKGEEFLESSDDCPYCTSPAGEKKEIIRSIKQEYNHTNIGHLNEIINVMDSLGEYFATETRNRLQEIISNKGNISSEQKTYLAGIRPDIETLQKKLSVLKDISFFSFKESENVQEKISEFRIDLQFLPHLNSEPVKKIVDRVNQSLQDVESKIGQLQGQIAQQKKGIENTIRKHTTEINNFLMYAGYKYKVEIEENTYKMRLLHNEHTSHIEHSSKYLSYGERNAFALVLFMYECLSKNLDLIILDDPISSFDKNKKFAITEKLFRGEESFRGKTVLMVTHDIEPIIDIVNTFHSNFCEFSSASFLENENGVIREITITKSDIKSFGNVCTSNIERVQDDIIRSIYLRRYYEILDNKGNEYHMLSSLFKKRPVPTLDRNEDNEMPQSDRDAAIIAIQKDICSFDYDAIVTRLNNEAGMYVLYQNAGNNYEKLQIYRIIMQAESQSELHKNSVIRKFINETFHVENEYVMQLDPSKFSPVPQYIIDECDRVLEQRYSEAEAA